MYLLSCPGTRQLYRIGSRHPPGHPVTATVVMETIKRHAPHVGQADHASLVLLHLTLGAFALLQFLNFHVSRVRVCRSVCIE